MKYSIVVCAYIDGEVILSTVNLQADDEEAGHIEAAAIVSELQRNNPDIPYGYYIVKRT